MHVYNRPIQVLCPTRYKVALFLPSRFSWRVPSCFSRSATWCSRLLRLRGRRRLRRLQSGGDRCPCYVRCRWLNLSVRRSLDLGHALLTFIAGYVPLIEERLYQLDKEPCFVRVNINNQVDVLLHMRADIADLPQRVDGIPSLSIYLSLQCVDLLHEAGFLNAPEVPYHALKTAPRQCC